jgi:hypothetical protein
MYIMPDSVKINKEKRSKIHILIVMNEIEVVSTDYQLEIELVLAEHDLYYMI